MTSIKQLLSTRPAESAAASLGLTAQVTAVVTGDWRYLIPMAVGYVPGVVTFVETHGGLAGVWHLVVHGTAKP